MEDLMISNVAIIEMLNAPIREEASNYRHIIDELMDKLECGMLCLKNVAIEHNGGRHCILVRDLSSDGTLSSRIDAVVERLNRLRDLNNIEITISRNDIAKNERFNYSYIVLVQQERVTAELP